MSTGQGSLAATLTSVTGHLLALLNGMPSRTVIQLNSLWFFKLRRLLSHFPSCRWTSATFIFKSCSTDIKSHHYAFILKMIPRDLRVLCFHGCWCWNHKEQFLRSGRSIAVLGKCLLFLKIMLLKCKCFRN